MSTCNAADVFSDLKRYTEECVAERNAGRENSLYELPEQYQNPMPSQRQAHFRGLCTT